MTSARLTLEQLRERRLGPPGVASLKPPKQKLSDEERVPLMVQATAPLRSSSARYGFAHVQLGPKGKYFCFYKGISTTPQETPMLAAYELLKAAKRMDIDVTDKIEVIYYPEYFYPTPKHIDLDAIEYLREPHVKAGWKGIKLRDYKTGRRFVCDVVLDGVVHRSKSYPTPVEAVWAVHLGRTTKPGQTKKSILYEQKPDTKGLVDLSIIDYLQEGSGYKYVIRSKGMYRGRFTISGVAFYTDFYKTPEQAAWAVHHHLQDAPEVDSVATRTAALAAEGNGKDVVAAIRAEYSTIPKLPVPKLPAWLGSLYG